jgi:hypothetical protein
LALVIQVIGSATVGSFLEPFLRVVVVFGFWPLRRAMAAVAAPFTSSGTYLNVVPDCQPARMYCTPCAVASWPLSGTGGRCFAFRSAITAPAMLSFAAMTPWMLLFVDTSIWLKMVDALFASQSGTNFVGPFFSFLALKSGLRTASLPLLNQNAF